MFSWKKMTAALGLSLTLLTAGTATAAPIHPTKSTTTHHVVKHRKASTKHRKAGAKHRKAGAKRGAHRKATAKRHAAARRTSTRVAHRAPAVHTTAAVRPVSALHTHG